MGLVGSVHVRTAYRFVIHGAHAVHFALPRSRIHFGTFGKAHVRIRVSVYSAHLRVIERRLSNIRQSADSRQAGRQCSVGHLTTAHAEAQNEVYQKH